MPSSLTLPNGCKFRQVSFAWVHLSGVMVSSHLPTLAHTCHLTLPSKAVQKDSDTCRRGSRDLTVILFNVILTTVLCLCHLKLQTKAPSVPFTMQRTISLIVIAQIRLQILQKYESVNRQTTNLNNSCELIWIKTFYLQLFFIVAKNNCNYFLIVYYLQIKSLHCYVLAEIAVQ